MNQRYLGEEVSLMFLRLALAASYLSAVADRFGLWGGPGQKNVVWGNFASFQSYTGTLNWFVPANLLPALAWTATGLEVLIAVCLLFAIRLRQAAFASGLLLSLFFLSMSFSIGIKAPLDYSVCTAAAASFFMFFSLRK